MLAKGKEAENEKATSMVGKVKSLEVEIVHHPAFVTEYYMYPCVKLSDGKSYSGLEGIQFFVDNVQKISKRFEETIKEFKPQNQAEHLGDGAYVTYDGSGYIFTANHHDPMLASDRVYMDAQAMSNLLAFIKRTIKSE